uniref:MX dynamin like GTPase 1 n=1 Tax=Pseudonaja textilis TaxID=8673 RepID=A0A670YTC0_PSETE
TKLTLVGLGEAPSLLPESTIRCKNYLCSQYEQKIRPCIDLIDSLRALGVEKDLALPAIAVIGDQSSGKSSVLEALSGVALPKGSGIVTRCPLELKMKKNNKQKWKGKIMYLETEVKLEDSSEVEDAVRRAQNAIAGEGLDVSDKLITLEISSPDVPDLTLIDLPGITRVAVGTQPPDIGKQIMTLIKRYITKQETINLVVIPSNVDIATTEALKMAQIVDPEGERTLGILTKPDLIDEGTENETVDIVRNQRVPLKKGYMIVKCRGQSDLTNKLSLEDAVKKEREFFEEHKFFSRLLKEGRATIPFLAERLTQELTKHIQLVILFLKLCYFAFFPQKINAFNEDLLKIVHGEEDVKHLTKRTITDIRKAFNEWQDTINENNEENWTVFNRIQKKGTGNIEYIRGRELPGFVNFKTFEIAIRKQIQQLECPANAVLKEVAELVRNAFLKLAIQHFSSFYALCRSAQGKIEELKSTQEEKAENMIRTQFELENIVYCQDTIYREDFGTVRAKKISSNENDSDENDSDENDSAKECSVEEMLYHVAAYFKRASRLVSSLIPLIIQLYMFKDFAERLQKAMLQLLQNGDQLEDLFHEEEDIVNRRNYFKERIERLHKAQKLLKKF